MADVAVGKATLKPPVVCGYRGCGGHVHPRLLKRGLEFCSSLCEYLEQEAVAGRLLTVDGKGFSQLNGSAEGHTEKVLLK